MTQEVFRKTYGDATLIVKESTLIVKEWSVMTGKMSISFPFTFEIIWEGKTWTFPTMTNRCDSKQSAIMRGWHRCQWLNNHTFFERYQ